MFLKNTIYHLKRYYHLVKTGWVKGLVAQVKYGFPHKKLQIFAITGTDGKTTSTSLLYHLLKSKGYKVGLISTVAAYIGDEEQDTGFHVTSPQPDALYSFLNEMVKQGVTHLVLEATSHGLYQFRTWGIRPQVAGLTNITHEHLDYHLTYQNYVAAKGLLFKAAKIAVLNKADKSYPMIRKMLKNKKKIVAYQPELNDQTKLSKAIKDRFPEKYNQANAILVLTMLEQIGFNQNEFYQYFESFPNLPGRMEWLQTDPFGLVVDFAHTPHGLESALESLNSIMKKEKYTGRLIAIYGSAGLRDFTKRPVMGKIGANLADLVIFTAEDPRTEDVWSIINQMKSDLGDNHSKVLTIPDRKEAIIFAITKLAKPGDVIGIFGKGHEQSMCFGTTETPWNDKTAALEVPNGKK